MRDHVKTLAGRVWSTLGPGFSERVYHNAMEVGLRQLNIPYQTERIVPIVFDGHTIGNIRADLIVDSRILVELKSVRALKDEHRVQTQMYMKLLQLPEGLLINFPSGGEHIEMENFNIDANYK
ncbi:GxxExxY protein [bacterium]|nr:GxxExxY protein [bacterium]